MTSFLKYIIAHPKYIYSTPQIYIYIQYCLQLYIYIYIYKSKHTRQRLAVATQSFTPVGDLQATDISNLLHAHINKADI